MIYKILCLFDIDRIRCGKMLPVVSDTEAAVPDTIPAMSKGRHKEDGETEAITSTALDSCLQPPERIVCGHPTYRSK